MASFFENLNQLPAPDELRALVSYDPETGTLTWKRRAGVKENWNTRYAGKAAFSQTAGQQGYFGGKLGPHKLYAHRVVWAIIYGYWPEYVDHIDRDKKNNRITNLREVTNKENSRNASLGKNNTSGHFGVSWHSGGQFWTAAISVDYKSIYLGRFHTKDEAIAARKAAELKYGFFDGHGSPPIDEAA